VGWRFETHFRINQMGNQRPRSCQPLPCAMIVKFPDIIILTLYTTYIARLELLDTVDMLGYGPQVYSHSPPPPPSTFPKQILPITRVFRINMIHVRKRKQCDFYHASSLHFKQLILHWCRKGCLLSRQTTYYLINKQFP
jgi:hypothetical protein